MKKDGIRYPSIDQLVEKVGSKYILVIGAAKRSKELALINPETNEPTMRLITKPHNVKNLGIALEEIYEGKIVIKKLNVKGEEELLIK
ncbi:MAG: DNA-directed RNA polymerase subunit omega [Bacilli bacterium]|nr:DNA-directed RNA polymerase subunit omega [Bacilli bacterium]